MSIFTTWKLKITKWFGCTYSKIVLQKREQNLMSQIPNLTLSYSPFLWGTLPNVIAILKVQTFPCTHTHTHIHTHTHFVFSNHCICRMPKKENNLNCIPKVLLASEQSNKGSEVRNAMLALHFRQLEKRKNSTKDQKCFSVLAGSQEAERTGEVRVKPVSPWRAGQASNHTKLLHTEFSHTYTHLGAPKKADTSFFRMHSWSLTEELFLPADD